MSLQELTAASLLADGGRLLAVLAGDSRITFQTFDEKPIKHGGLVRIFHGPLAQHADALASLNRDGASINFMVNEGDGRARRGPNVVRVRALFVDLDGAPLDPVLSGPLHPHAVVQSSPGRFHAYWLVDGVGLEDFTPLQKSLAAKFGGDRSVHDLARVMRLPGTMHHKHEPTPCELLAIHDLPRYSRAEVVEAFGMATPEAPKKSKLTVLDGSVPEGERNATLFQLARGFVNKGLPAEEVLQRIQKVNALKCAVPLCAKEVDAIVASAVSHGPSGFLNLPLQVVDSLAYRQLSHPARSIAVAAYRRYNGENNGEIALPFSEFGVEFSRRQTFYKARKELEASGLLKLVRKRRYDEWAGRKPDLFEVALSTPGGPMTDRSAAI